MLSKLILVDSMLEVGVNCFQTTTANIGLLLCRQTKRSISFWFVYQQRFSTDRTQMNNRIHFVHWFFNRLLLELTNIKSRHSSKPLTVSSDFMRAFFAIVFSLLFVCECSAQDERFYIVQNAMRRWQDTGKLVYVRDELSFSGYQEVLLKGKLNGGDKETKANKLYLTKADKQVIREKLDGARTARWRDSLFENSIGIKGDTLDALLSDKNKGWPYFHQRLGKGYFQFSEPLIIRNGAYALFGLIHMVGSSAGYNLLFVYKKEGANWKRFIMMPLGAW